MLIWFWIRPKVVVLVFPKLIILCSSAKVESELYLKAYRQHFIREYMRCQTHAPCTLICAPVPLVLAKICCGIFEIGDSSISFQQVHICNSYMAKVAVVVRLRWTICRWNSMRHCILFEPDMPPKCRKEKKKTAGAAYLSDCAVLSCFFIFFFPFFSLHIFIVISTTRALAHQQSHRWYTFVHLRKVMNISESVLENMALARLSQNKQTIGFSIWNE